MRGHQHGERALDDGLLERLQELAPGQRVQRGGGLVEDQDLRALGERERDLGLLADGPKNGRISRR
jgi:hypothetical protein